jgi:tetratricopeptide (TPR) repeat protein
MSEARPGTHNRFDGDAATVVQLGEVRDGLHIHHHHEPPQRQVAPARQVPPPPDHYTNNETQLAKLDAVLAHRSDQDGPRIGIIRGEPGSGRSTLADAWLHHHGADYPDGQFLVRLTGGADGEQVRVALAEMLAAVGFNPEQIPASLDGRSAMWRTWSAGQRIAMIVDDALTPAQVRAVLPGAGKSVVLAIEAGRLAGLKARGSAEYVTIDPLSVESATLLLGRMAGSEHTAAEPDAVRRLVDRCAGSATALNVVGALLFEGKQIARLADRLADDERALRELSRDRDLSLTVVFDAAYNRLEPLAQRCYRLLGAHPGGGDVALGTLAAVLGEPADDVEHELGGLLRAMLVTEPTDCRYLMSGLLSVHARAKVGPDTEDIRRRTVAWYLDRALAASQAWMPHRGWLQAIWPDLVVPQGMDQGAAIRWMTAERANLRSAVEAAYALGELTWVCQFAVALWPLHDRGKYSYDMETVNRLGADAARTLGDHLAESLIESQHGFAYRQREELDRAAELFAASLAAAQRSGSTPAEASAIEALGLARFDQGRRDEAAELLRRNLALAELIGMDRRTALARFHLAKPTPPAEALELLTRARERFGEDPYNLVKIDLWRGIKLAEDGRLAEAASLLADVSAQADGGGWHLERGQACEALASVATRGGDLRVARSHLRDALDVYRLRGFASRAVGVEDRLSELD